MTNTVTIDRALAHKLADLVAHRVAHTQDNLERARRADVPNAAAYWADARDAAAAMWTRLLAAIYGEETKPGPEKPSAGAPLCDRCKKVVEPIYSMSTGKWHWHHGGGGGAFCADGALAEVGGRHRAPEPAGVS